MPQHLPYAADNDDGAIQYVREALRRSCRRDWAGLLADDRATQTYRVLRRIEARATHAQIDQRDTFRQAEINRDAGRISEVPWATDAEVEAARTLPRGEDASCTTPGPSTTYEARQRRVDQLIARYRYLATKNPPESVRQTMLAELSLGSTWWRPKTWWKPDRKRHVRQYALLIVAVERLAVEA